MAVDKIVGAVTGLFGGSGSESGATVGAPTTVTANSVATGSRCFFVKEKDQRDAVLTCIHVDLFIITGEEIDSCTL